MEYTEHPIEAQRIHQKMFLSKLSEREREYHAFIFRVGNLTYRYYMDLEAQPSEEDFKDWLLGLPENNCIKILSLPYEGSCSDF